MSVLVIGLNGRPLMPTTTRKARILLKEQKASVICNTGCADRDRYRITAHRSRCDFREQTNPESRACVTFLYGKTLFNGKESGLPPGA